MCDHERQYLLHQQRVQSTIEDDRIFVECARLNEHGFDMPTLPHITYDMLSDDNFMVTKMNEMVVGSGARVHLKHVSHESNEHVQIDMLNWTI